jgi:hypothetical protein
LRRSQYTSATFRAESTDSIGFAKVASTSSDAVGLGHLLKKLGLTSDLLDPLVAAVKQEEAKAGPVSARPSKPRAETAPEAD